MKDRIASVLDAVVAMTGIVVVAYHLDTSGNLPWPRAVKHDSLRWR